MLVLQVNTLNFSLLNKKFLDRKLKKTSIDMYTRLKRILNIKLQYYMASFKLASNLSTVMTPPPSEIYSSPFLRNNVG